MKIVFWTYNGLKTWWFSNNASNFSFLFNKIFVTLYTSFSSLSIMSLLFCSFKNIHFLMRRLQKLSVLLAFFYNFYVFMAHYFWNSVQKSVIQKLWPSNHKQISLKIVWLVKEACINTRIRTYSTCCWKYIKYPPFHLFVPY